MATENEKEQLRDFVSKGLIRAVVYMKTTFGLPEEYSIEKIDKMQTLGERMAFLSALYKSNRRIFDGMPQFIHDKG